MTTEESTVTNINLLDRIHIADCAAQRAQMYCFDHTRFVGEFETVRMWARYKCYISPRCSFVESD
jgi:hypothetical protein